jgi:hypothetical protein
MTPQAQLAMLVWLPITFYLFVRFPPRTAVIVSFIGGLLFLPRGAGFSLPLVPDYREMVATCYGIILGMFVYDPQRFSQFKPGWIDLPMLIWCLCPLFSSLTNDLGIYDGINAVLGQTANWGLPYYIGRLYLNSLNGLRELAINIVKGGILYAPLCLFESRMSPQLHYIIYGYYAHESGVSQAFRLGGWRPMVFMTHGLMVGLWMMTATLVALWLWRARVVQQIWGMPIKWIAIGLLLTFILIKSTGAYIYLLYGAVVLFFSQWIRNSLPLLLLMVGMSYYLFISASGALNGDGIVSFFANSVDADRAASLEFRFDNEKILAEKARERMLFGWGGWGRSRVYGENWEGDLVDISTTDSLWIITFGGNGLVGLVSLTASLLLPVVCFFGWRYPVKTWLNPKVAPAAVLAVALVLFMLDSLINAMFIPIFPLISGGLSGLVIKTPENLKVESPRLRRSKRSAIST